MGSNHFECLIISEFNLNLHKAKWVINYSDILRSLLHKRFITFQQSIIVIHITKALLRIAAVVDKRASRPHCSSILWSSSLYSTSTTFYENKPMAASSETFLILASLCPSFVFHLCSLSDVLYIMQLLPISPSQFSLTILLKNKSNIFFEY